MIKKKSKRLTPSKYELFPMISFNVENTFVRAACKETFTLFLETTSFSTGNTIGCNKKINKT